MHVNLRLNIDHLSQAQNSFLDVVGFSLFLIQNVISAIYISIVNITIYNACLYSLSEFHVSKSCLLVLVDVTNCRSFVEILNFLGGLDLELFPYLDIKCLVSSCSCSTTSSMS